MPVKEDKAKTGSQRPQSGSKKSVSARFRHANILLFAIAIAIIMLAMFIAFDVIVKQISADHARRYAISSSDAFSAHISREMGLMAIAARSETVVAWLDDVGNADKMNTAYEELAGILNELYSNILYIGTGKTLQQYKVEHKYAIKDLVPFEVFDVNNPRDAWFFECMASGEDYTLDIALDDVLGSKHVWFNYKVVKDGVPLGVISTGIEFSHVAAELFSQYEENLRGLIVDKNGIIHIDSALLNNEDFLRNEFELKINEMFYEREFLSVISAHLDGISGNFDATGEPAVVKLSSGRYSYAAIVPIKYTSWFGIILYDSSPVVNMGLFVPAFITALILLVAVALATTAISRKFIFKPLECLVQNLAQIKENQEVQL
jgi:C4-dicarboxylate-specific signal transduction histidine kinase